METWEAEFNIAKQFGFYSIEWIFELNNYKNNPIWTETGRRKICEIVTSSGVGIESVCADYFLKSPFYRVTEDVRSDNICLLQTLIRYSSEIGAKTILLPVLEDSEIRDDDERKLLQDAIDQCIPFLEEYEIKLGIEAELPAREYLELVSYFNSPYVGAYYDSGNCAAKGFDMREDVQILSDKLMNIHLKDRLVGGQSTYLGCGACNFEGALPMLVKQGYEGLLVMQAYFGNDYIEDTERNKKYIEDILDRSTL